MLQNTKYQKLNSEFKTLITSKNYRGSNTAYTTPVNEFLQYLEGLGILDLNKITTSVMVQYYDFLSTRANKRLSGTLSQSTINKHLLSIGLLFDYFLETGVVNKAVFIPKFGISSFKQRNSLTQEQTLELFNVTNTKLERAILSVAYGCGLRRTELQRLNTRDIQFNNGVLIVVEGKNSKRREVPLSEGVIRDLKDYFINERSDYLKDVNQFAPAFFVSKRSTRLSGQQLARMLNQIIERTENSEIIDKNITLHCLRHSFAEHLVARGADIEFVREILGHNSIDTSYLYCVKHKNKKLLSVA